MYRLILIGCCIFSIFISANQPQHTTADPCMVVVKSGDKISNGVIVSADGYVVTTSHSIERQKKVSVRVDEDWYKARVIYQSVRQDLALIQISVPKKWPFAEMSHTKKIGQSVVVKSWRFDFQTYHTAFSNYRQDAQIQLSDLNIYPSTQTDEEGAERVFADVAILNIQAQRGDSGSGVYDSEGRLVGILSTTNKKGSKQLTVVQSLDQIQQVLLMESVGRYESKARRFNWFLQGLIQTAKNNRVDGDTIQVFTERAQAIQKQEKLSSAMSKTFQLFNRSILKSVSS
ncbi:S1 family peptidase [Pleionea sediminis]|uniref:S1 family peptidase n=1 Tax=Pleionea sediminis TaxID=2569479 RepID=UPI001184C754|nr:serine protease [Pleionea sediminis]